MGFQEVGKILRREDLARSGLEKTATIRKLRLGEVLSVPRTAERTGIEGVASYEIPYYGPRGEDLRYSRFKLLPVDAEPDIKYYQDEKTIPRLYLPQLADWEAICADTSVRLTVTEGEKKAACATLAGVPCVALGGVWSFTSKRWHLRDIPDWDWFDLSERDVEICYDGDMYTNENVARALDVLTHRLTARGARVYVRYLPTLDGLSKLDDFLVERGVAEYLELQCAEAETSAQMRQLNDDLVYVKDIRSYYSTHERILYGGLEQLRRRYGSVKISGESGRLISAINEWVEWPHMRMADRITYAPGRELFVDGSLNGWSGWGVEPRRGVVAPFLELVRSVDESEWLLQWLAYPLQNPGAKMYSAVLLWSAAQGTGKTFIGDVMRDIYGENAAVITSGDLHDDSMEWMRCKQFVLGEEVLVARSRADAGVLKHVITGDSVRVNEKYVPHYTLPNLANFMFTSNKPDAMILDRGDRRFFVEQMEQQRPLSFWQGMDKWRRREGGPAAVMWHLLNQVDCSSFNPLAPPPATEDKAQMQYAGLTSLQQWVEDLLLDPTGAVSNKFDEATAEAALRRDVFTTETIMGWLPEDLERSTNRVALGNALRTAGAVVNSSPVRLSTRKMVRLYAIQNVEYWRERVGRNVEWAANYEKKTETIGAERRGRRKK